MVMYIPKIMGYKSFYIETGSMSPTIPQGSMVLEKMVDFEDITEGDVLTFKNTEGTEVTYDEMSELKKTATEYLSYKNQKGYNKNALGKIAAADGILSFVEAYENKDTNMLKNISTEKNAVDKIMGAVKADKSIAKVYDEKKEKISFTSLLKDEIRGNSAKEAKKVQPEEKKEKSQDMKKGK